MHDPNDPAFQRQCQKLFFQCFQIIFFLTGSYKVYQDLAGSNASPDHQMSQISYMLQLSVIRSSFLPEKISYTYQNIRHISVDKFTVIRIQNIISAALLMKSQRKWSVFILVTKRKFHFVAVSEFFRASVNPFPDKISLSFCICLSALDQCFFQKFPDLVFLHGKLVLIRHSLVHAASTCGEITADRFSCLLW